MQDVVIECEVLGRSGYEEAIKFEDLGRWTANEPSTITELTVTEMFVGGKSVGDIITSSNVGIGDTSPTEGKLVVDAGNEVNVPATYFRHYHTSIADMTPTVSIYSDANNNRSALLKLNGHGNPEDATIWMVTRDNEWTFGAQHEGKFIIADNSKNVSSNERLVIDTSGNVGIGTTSPSQTLTVAGNISGSGTLNIDGNATFAGDIAVASGKKYLVQDGNCYVGRNSNDMYLYAYSGHIFAGNSGEHGRFDNGGNLLPGADNARNLGGSSKRWANLYVADAHYSNVGTGGNDVDGTEGSWTIQEGEEDLFLLNRKNGKKFKIKLEEIE
jgi:cytoskeletal protein CcmA (bactofilin family)